jgi:site-specific recombinase XerD
MTLIEAVDAYIARRRSQGAQFVSTEFILRLFCRFCGNVDLHDLSAARVTAFLKSSKGNAATMASKLSAIKCFLLYWSDRDFIPVITLENVSTRRKRRHPYLYTRSELKVLFEHAGRRSCPQDGFDGQTFRMILLMLYATGGAFLEVLNLRQTDVNLNESRLSFCRSDDTLTRSIPIGPDLSRELNLFMNRPGTSHEPTRLLFCDKDGKPIRCSNLWYRFVKTNQSIGRTGIATGHTPRPHDLKFTFAVHRLSSCIRSGEKMNEIVPALSTYLGYSSLTRAEEFLSYVPERFNEDLRKLSPVTTERHWRDRPELLSYLQSL